MKNTQCKYPNRLKEFRIKAGLTQKQIAENLSMQCEDRLSHWERGQGVPSLKNLKKLCGVYKVTFDEIYPI